MPDMADLTVKKNDEVTNVVYSKVQASAGDRSPAVWRNTTVGTAAGHRPEIRMSTRENGTGTARRIDVTGTYPTLVTDAGGKTQVADKLVMNLSVVNPKGMPDTDVNEAVAQFFNVLASTLVKSATKAGYAPS